VQQIIVCGIEVFMEPAVFNKREGINVHRRAILRTRQELIEAGNTELEKGVHWRQPITLIYVDLDEFAKFKLQHGESETNALLRELADTFQKLFRSGDLLSHLHDDEFLFVLPGTYPEDALEILHRIRKTLDELFKSNRWPITASIGAVTHLNPPPSVEPMIENVERVVQAVKQSGKAAVKHEVLS
jgi:diguanylate cyclase (GGDEF)-like protein